MVGHLLEIVDEYLSLKQKFGKQDAMKLMRFQRGHLKAVQDLVGADIHLADSQLRQVEFVGVYFDKAKFDEAGQKIQEFIKDMPEEARGFAHHTRQKLPVVRLARLWLIKINNAQSRGPRQVPCNNYWFDL